MSTHSPKKVETKTLVRGIFNNLTMAYKLSENMLDTTIRRSNEKTWGTKPFATEPFSWWNKSMAENVFTSIAFLGY